MAGKRVFTVEIEDEELVMSFRGGRKYILSSAKDEAKNCFGNGLGMTWIEYVEKGGLILVDDDGNPYTNPDGM